MTSSCPGRKESKPKRESAVANESTEPAAERRGFWRCRRRTFLVLRAKCRAEATPSTTKRATVGRSPEERVRMSRGSIVMNPKLEAYVAAHNPAPDEVLRALAAETAKL